MELQELLDNIEKIDTDRGYWFVRTDTGLNFETFVENKFIGIGWNEITTEDILTKTPIEVKDKIAKAYDLDLSTTKGKQNNTQIYNKLMKFAELKKGDLIVIPSRGGEQLAFGEIADSQIYNDVTPINNCDYVKRRRVRWMVEKNIDDLDPTYYKIKKPVQTIFDIKEYQPYLDKITETLYKRNDYVHYILDLRTKHDIDLNLLVELMESINELISRINETFGFGEEELQISVKLNLQSPGSVEFIRQIGRTLIILGFALSSCTSGKETGNKEVDTFVKVNKPLLDQTDKVIKKLDGDREKIKNL
jgi:predicted Mrr-cat superfamily restriction endonuclease